MVSEKKDKLVHLEVLRIISIILVMFNHTEEKGFLLFTVADNSIAKFIYLFFSILCKIAVPVFFMISGALLLGRNESIKDVLKKRVLRFALTIVGISFFYYIFNIIVHNEQYTPLDMFLGIYRNGVANQLWYLYSYLGCLVMLPLLRPLAQNMKTEHFFYLIAVHILVVGLIPVAESFIGGGYLHYAEDFSLVIFTTQNIFFFLIGYFLEKVLDKKYFTLNNALTLNLAGIMSICVTELATLHHGAITGEWTRYHENLIAIPAIAAYFTFKFILGKTKEANAFSKALCFLGSNVFGIYLFEPLFTGYSESIFNVLAPHIKVFPATLIWMLAAFIFGTIVVGLLRLIPGVKKIL